MRLMSFTVENYRSITKARKIPTGDRTILIGPNNEGKSNILRALVTAMRVLTRAPRTPFARRLSPWPRYESSEFNWERDFPVSLQERKPTGKSVVILEFGLSDEEVRDFRDDIGSSLRGTLPLRVRMGRDSIDVTVAKQGRGAKSLGAKSRAIGRFVASRLDFEHIPAVRTAESAKAVVEQLVERELRVLEEDDAYREALHRIEELQRPVLDQLSERVKSTLQTFLPDLRDVRIDISSERRFLALRRSCEVRIDDGVATLLEHKGDGVQSLAAIGLMRHASERRGAQRNLVVAIEEPESHLHPAAIHQLRDVIELLAEKHQVVLTTHCPLFVNRTGIESNVLVLRSRARPAKSIQEIRTMLGVRASDNLQHADLVLLVEGDKDKVSLEALFRHYSGNLKDALRNGMLLIESLGGCSNLAYKASLVVAALCDLHCFLDYDKAGKDAFDKAKKEGVVTEKNVHFATCGKRDAEIEDMYNPVVYSDMVESDYGVHLNVPYFRSAHKWSDRMRNTFESQGKKWDAGVAAEVKGKIAELVAARPAQALMEHTRGAFDSLVGALEKRIQTLRENKPS